MEDCDDFCSLRKCLIDNFELARDSTQFVLVRCWEGSLSCMQCLARFQAYLLIVPTASRACRESSRAVAVFTDLASAVLRASAASGPHRNQFASHIGDLVFDFSSF